MHRPIIDARLEIHFATAMRKSVPESNPMLRIIAPHCRVRLGGEDEGKRKEKERMLRFAIAVSFASSLRCIEPQRQAASSSCGAYTGAHARPLGLHMRYFFCLSVRTHAPHARDVLAQSYVTLPRVYKNTRGVYPRYVWQPEPKPYGWTCRRNWSAKEILSLKKTSFYFILFCATSLVPFYCKKFVFF